MYLAETTAETRSEWIAALRTLEALEPAHVVAGHKHPGHIGHRRAQAVPDESVLIQVNLSFEDLRVRPVPDGDEHARAI